MATQTALRDADFARLLAFRDGLRRFHRWSQDKAKAVGLTTAQHQLLLAIRGHGSPPSVGDIARHLMLRHHSVVELIDRATAGGLVERLQDKVDHRVVRLRLTELGHESVEALAETHLEELSRLREQFNALWQDLPASV